MKLFSSLGVASDIVEQLARIGITTPTPIQSQAIPYGLAGRDVIGIAQTGTGKTLAFGLPMIARLSRTKSQGLILVPTRELDDQAEASLASVGQRFGLRTALLIGGAAMGRQVTNIRRRPHIIIATPGRLIDHLEQRTLSLDQVSILVLDEADRMLDMGFAPQVNKILAVVPTNRQTMLFSATMPPAIVDLSQRTAKNPVTVSVTPSGTTADRIDQSLTIVEKTAKSALLKQLLAETSGPTLVFTRTKYGAKKLCRTVSDFGVSAAEIHGNRSLPQRREALAGFKSGRYRVLVATDIAARGIDVIGISLVINYDLPEQSEDYIHRIGRTARAGKSGRAVSFAEPNQSGDIRAIERLIGSSIPRDRTLTSVQFSGQSTTPSSDSSSRRSFNRNQPRRPDHFRQRGNRNRTTNQSANRSLPSSSNAPATHQSWANTPLRSSSPIPPPLQSAQPPRPVSHPSDQSSPFII